MTGASASQTGLAGAEAPEPHSRLGPSDGIPSAYDTQDALDRMGSFLCILEGADHDGQRELWLQAIDDSVFKRDFRVLYMSFENLSKHATRWLRNWLDSATHDLDFDGAELVWANLPTYRNWASLTDAERALVRHQLNCIGKNRYE